MTRICLRVDVEGWTHDLTAVWKPARILEVRNEGLLGLLLIAQVHSGLTLHLRVQWNGIERCMVWQGKRYLLWDRALGFCTEPAPLSREQDEWQRQVSTLIRRNCYLMGCEIGATPGEKRQWLDEFEAAQCHELPQAFASAEAR